MCQLVIQGQATPLCQLQSPLLLCWYPYLSSLQAL